MSRRPTDKPSARLALLPRAWALAWRATGPATAGWLGLTVLQGLVPLGLVYLVRALVNSAAALLSGDASASALESALLLVLAFAGITLFSELFNAAAEILGTLQSEMMRDYATALVHERCIALDLVCYETPDYYDRLHRARYDTLTRPLDLLRTSGALLRGGITFASMLVVLLQFGAWVPLALLLSVLPAFVVAMRFERRQYDWSQRRTPFERRLAYFSQMLTTAEPAAEVRLFGLGEHFRSAYDRLRAELRGEQVRLSRSQTAAMLAARSLALVVTGACIAWILWRASREKGSLGDVALFYQAFRYGQQLTRSLMEGLGRVYANTLFLGNLFDFLALRPSVADPPDPRPAPRELRQDIRFEGVAFRYAGSDRPVLEGFDLLLPAGRIAAIVGPNGAGKSTLIKLICRFYDPEAGRVTVDGTDIRVLGVNDWRQRLTVLFQSPVRYNATLAENIALGDLAVSPGRQEIEAAAQAAGADAVAAHLPQGYDTLLGKSFAGGTDLSVGEWQRVALARGFLRKAPIIILDEPTSAMDSWAEADWLERFRSLTAGKTAVLVTHRFSTAMCADVIFVMSGGRIVESGTHQDLLAAGGLYAQSWHRQHGPTPAGGVQ